MVWAALCTIDSNIAAGFGFSCTSVLNPQESNADRKVIHRVIHNPSPFLAGPRRGCPQDAHPLILLLRSLRHFFIENHPWGNRSHSPHKPLVDRLCRALGLAFKMALNDLRLFFDAPPFLAGGKPAVSQGWPATGFRQLGEGKPWTWRRQELASPT